MNKILSIIIACPIIFSQCGEVNLSTANFSNVKMCGSLKNDECSSDNTVFASADPSINTSVTLNNAPSDSKVTFAWYYIDSARTLIGSFDTDLTKVENNGSTYSLHCSVNSPEGGWPAGKYEVEMKIHSDNSKPLVKSFSVK